MPYTVTITKTSPNDTAAPEQAYQQTVDALNLQAVITAVNTPPPAPKKVRSDKGKPKAKKTWEAAAV